MTNDWSPTGLKFGFETHLITRIAQISITQRKVHFNESSKAKSCIVNMNALVYTDVLLSRGIALKLIFILRVFKKRCFCNFLVELCLEQFTTVLPLN